MQLLNKLAYFIVFILVTGCATILPMNHEFKSHENFPAPYNKVWNLSNNFLSKKVSPIKTEDIKSGFLETKEFKVSYEGFQYKSKYADCGQLAGLYVYHEIVGQYQIYISELAANRTTLRIVPNYRASLWLGKSFKGWVQCESRGHIENLLISDIWANIQKLPPEEAQEDQSDEGQEAEDILKPDAQEAPTIKAQEVQSENDEGQEVANISKPDNEMDTKKDDIKTDEPEKKSSIEIELSNLMLKYEKVLEERDELNNELIVLKQNNKIEESKDPIVPELSHEESPSEVDEKSGSDILTQLDMKSVSKEQFSEFEAYKQNRDNKSLMYTIQTGSFQKLERARVQFDFIAELLQDEDYDNLRIEKIGDVYAVRLGKFDSYSSAKDMLRNYIADLLQAKDYYNIKIEQTDDAYTVRLGKYDKYSSAKTMLKKVIRAIRSPIVLKVYVKENRIMQPKSTKSQ